MSEEFTLRPDNHPARRHCIQAITMAPDGSVVKILPPKRSTQQNALMWSLLSQLVPKDWYGNHLTKEEWKDVITASLKRQKVVPGLDGGFVVCGEHTSTMSIKEMGDVIEATLAFGAQQGIKFKDVHLPEPPEKYGRTA